MPGPTELRPYEQLAQKWRDLAERRREHFADLYSSGRWRHYYTEEQFIEQMRGVVRSVEAWARLASPTVSVEPAE
jgi:uncharacterized repeat protein (TIGR03809 family)